MYKFEIAGVLGIHQFQVNSGEFDVIDFIIDAIIAGSGAYAVNGIGAASATGDGDTMMRFLPSFIAIESLRNGNSPKKAAQLAIERIREYHPKFFGAIIVVNAKGEYAAACNGMESFPFSVATRLGGTRVETVPCK